MKFLKLFFISMLVITFSCSSSGGDDTQTPPDTEEGTQEETGNENEGGNETEEEEEEETSETKIVDGIKIGPNYVVFEPEVTKSDLGLWVLRKKGEANYYPDSGNFRNSNGDIGALNDTYLEFTGNNLNGGAAKSPLKYTFVCPKDGKYRLVMRMLQPLESCVAGTNHCSDAGYELGDKRNDLWFKIEGDFTTASTFPTDQLKKNHKFWGRGVRKWGSIHKMEGHINGVKKHSNVVVNFKKDEEYTLTISGRAQGCSIDYIIFYEQNLEQSDNFEVDIHTDIAAAMPEYLRPEISE